MTVVIPSVLYKPADGSVAAPDASGAETGATLKVACWICSDIRPAKARRPMVADTITAFRVDNDLLYAGRAALFRGAGAPRTSENVGVWIVARELLARLIRTRSAAARIRSAMASLAADGVPASMASNTA